MNTTAVARASMPSTGKPLGLTFPALFAAASTPNPSSVAVTDGGRSWTWAQWQATATRILTQPQFSKGKAHVGCWTSRSPGL